MPPSAAYSILRKAATGGATSLFGVPLRSPSNKPVTGGRFANGESAGPLLYFAHSHVGDRGFDLGLHPHDQIEIYTWIWNGTAEHYDTAVQQWKPMEAGSMQVIRAGTGIQHAERASPNMRAFQIWFNPSHKDLPAPSYEMYGKQAFKTANSGPVSVTPCVGAGGPINSDVPGLLVQRMESSADATTSLEAGPGRLGVAFVLDGTVGVTGEAAPLERDDALVVKGGSRVELELAPGSNVFFMSFPKTAG